MTVTRILLAAALAVTTGAAYAQSKPEPPRPVWQSNSAPMAGSSESNASLVRGSSSAPLSALLRDWDQAGFSTPSKPSQFRVYGRDGYVTSGPGYNTMVSLIRAAVRDSREGRDQEALAEIAKTRQLLDRG